MDNVGIIQKIIDVATFRKRLKVGDKFHDLGFQFKSFKDAFAKTKRIINF